MDIEAIFNGSLDEAEAPTPEVIVEAPEAPEIVEQPALEQPPEPEAPATPEVKDEEGRNIPLPVFLDMRDRAKAAERRAEELEAQRAPQPTPADMPDPIDDPQGFADWQTGQVQQALMTQRFEMSDLMAKQQHGEEAVKTAAEWAAEKARADPAFRQQYMQQPHPLDWIVREHKRNGLLTDIGDNVDDWFAREAAKRGYSAAPAPIAAPPGAAQAQPAPTPPTPPRSLASEPGKGGGVKEAPVGPMAALDAVFRG